MSRPCQPTILVVDDSLLLLETLSIILTDEGYEVSTATDGEAAIAQMHNHPFDLAILDYRLPGMSGIDILREIKTSHPRTAAIIMSAYLSEEVVEEAMRLGAYRCLSKPCDPRTIIASIEEAIHPSGPHPT